MAKSRRKGLRRVVEKEQGGAETVRLKKFEKHALGLREDGEEPPYVSLKYYDSNFECFSSWQPGELRQFSDFIRKLRDQRWIDVYRSGGKVGHKTGLGYTKHDDRHKLPNHSGLDDLSPEITFFELRISQSLRVHGFRVQAAFFLVWLDREHRIYPKG